MSSGDMLKRRYRLVRQIGSGTFASVYLAQDLSSQEYYAVKIIDKKWFDDEAMFERFTREVDLGMQLRHNHIIKVLSYGRTEQGYYIVMEWIKGITLRQFLQKKPNITTDLAISITQQVLSALAYAYHHGVTVHRDLKPENIMIEAKTGRVVVLDFGIAQIQGSYVTKHTRLFSLRYAAPEQLSESPNIFHPSTDLYAVAVMLYEMLTTQVPFKGRSLVELYELEKKRQFIPPHKINPSLSAGWQSFFEIALHPSPKQRFQTPILMKEDLQPFLTASMKKRSSSHASSKSLVTVALSVMVLILVGSAYFMQSKFKKSINFDRALSDLSARLEEKSNSMRHRLSLTSAIPVTLSIANSAGVDISHKLDIDETRVSENNQIFDLIKKKNDTFDFKNSDEIDIHLQSEDGIYEPIKITLRFRQDSNKEFDWELVKITIGDQERDFPDIFPKMNKKMIVLQKESPIWQPKILIKLDAKDAKKISLVENYITFFEAKLSESGITYLEKNKKNVLIFTNKTAKNRVEILCKITFAPDAVYELKLYYNGETFPVDRRWEKASQYVKNISNSDKTKHYDVTDGSVTFKLKVYDGKSYPTLVVTQVKKSTVTFQVSDEFSVPIHDALITITNQDGTEEKGSIRADQSGLATISLLPGHYRYKIESSQYEPLQEQLIVDEAPKTVNIQMEKKIEILSETASVNFIIQDKNGTPLKNAEIFLFDVQGKVVSRIYTQEDGIATALDIANGSYNCIVSCLGYIEHKELITINTGNHLFHWVLLENYN